LLSKMRRFDLTNGLVTYYLSPLVYQYKLVDTISLRCSQWVEAHLALDVITCPSIDASWSGLSLYAAVSEWKLTTSLCTQRDNMSITCLPPRYCASLRYLLLHVTGSSQTQVDGLKSPLLLTHELFFKHQQSTHVL
jgi:hypothetical protein